MATLTGNTIASTYTGLLSVTGAVGADTVEAVTDGAGTSTSLSLSQQRATITLGSGAADDFIVDGTTLVVEGDNNRVGIGTASPSYKLHVAEDKANDYAAYIINDNADGSGLRLRCDDSDGDEYLFYAETSTTARFAIKSDGNVGIGTTSPSSYNSNADNLVIHETGDFTGITLSADNNQGSNIYFADPQDDNVGGITYNHTSNYMNFRVNGSEKMRITSGGGINVGSGVLTSSSTDGNIVVDDGIYIGTYNGDNQIRSSSAGGGSATLYIGNAAIQVSSDERLKTNIVDTSISALDKINQVRVVDFNWNDPSDTSYNNRNARGLWTGVIAQEIVDVFPFAVNAPRNEEDLSIDNDSESIWQVDQSHLVPALIKALQEADDKIDALTARIEALEA